MVVSVKFKKDGKAYYFESEDLELNKEDYVLVETEKGIQFGFINDTNVDFKKNSVSDLKKVIRKADDKDYNKYLSNLKSAKEVYDIVKCKVEEDDIPMKIVDVSFTFDKKQLLINFIADERIDFRELVKFLAAKYKTYIEMHQIGVRDKAKEIGGLGQCGHALCCTTFKKSMEGISINMAKNQNISLNPSKINGCCGRLLCCLSYEDDVYCELRDKMPKINDEIEVDGQKCKVIKLDLLKGKVYVDLNGIEKVVDYNVE
ncbi:MAG: stage 0 sporulation protein [Bacilli bacterium]|nr:stage 0 sporulation protein [Bacilli bacterium]